MASNPTRRNSGTRITAGTRRSTTIESLAEDYLRWLTAQLSEEGTALDQYSDLARVLFRKEFLWTVPHDDNRVADGVDLRSEYAHDTGSSRSDLLMLGPGSFLEVLIGLSRRLAFSAGGSAPGWAHQLLDNLGLSGMLNPLSRRRARQVEEVMDGVIWRTYKPDGLGGFFPLAWPDEDQTQIELWYQMAAYIEEIHPEH